ncbi:L,D-transpeptidase family protein [Sphingorhabdus sp.]
MPRDWTDGCIALSNAEIAMLWKQVDDGTPITIQP